jgi:hypothetical protein
MPRSWEYTKARKIAMQAVLCAVLLVSVLFAWTISRQHEAQITPAQFETRTFSNLAVDVPKDWEVLPSTDSTLRVLEMHGLLGVNRGITIRVESLRRSSTATAKQIAVATLGELLGDQPIEPVDFLGQHGVLVEIPSHAEYGTMRAATLFACVILPSRQVVTVEVAGMHLISKSDRQLFLRLLSSMKLTAGAGDTVAAANSELRLAMTAAQ